MREGRILVLLLALFLVAAVCAADDPLPVAPGGHVISDLRLVGENLKQLIGNTSELAGVSEIRVVTYRFPPPPPGPPRMPPVTEFYDKMLEDLGYKSFFRRVEPHDIQLAYRGPEGKGLFSVLARPSEVVATRIMGEIDLKDMPLLDQVIRKAAIRNTPLGPAAMDRVQQAHRLLEEKKFQAAEKEFRELLKSDPNIPPANLGLARSLAGLGKTEDAAKAFRKAIEVDPLHPAARLEYARLLGWEKGDWENALYEIRQAVTLAPGLVGPLEWLAAALEKKGSYGEAVETCRRMIALGATKPEVYFRLGRNLEKTDAKDAALEAYKAALKLDPNFAQAREAVERIGVQD